MTDLITRLIDGIEYAEKNDYVMDDTSWAYREGVIISFNEAKNIVKAFEALKEVVTISDRKHNAWDKAKEALNAVSFNQLPLSYGEVMRSNPEIPSSDDDIKKLALKEYPITKFEDEFDYRFRVGFIAGYKQAKSESMFSLEDMREAIIDSWGSGEEGETFTDCMRRIIKSLKQKNNPK